MRDGFQDKEFLRTLAPIPCPALDLVIRVLENLGIHGQLHGFSRGLSAQNRWRRLVAINTFPLACVHEFYSGLKSTRSDQLIIYG
jgi:hypothetical protein